MRVAHFEQKLGVTRVLFQELRVLLESLLLGTLVRKLPRRVQSFSLIQRQFARPQPSESNLQREGKSTRPWNAYRRASATLEVAENGKVLGIEGGRGNPLGRLRTGRIERVFVVHGDSSVRLGEFIGPWVLFRQVIGTEHVAKRLD
jgi:hypothetical protein